MKTRPPRLSMSIVRVVRAGFSTKYVRGPSLPARATRLHPYDKDDSLRLTCIADRQHFPLMTIGFVPVDDAAAALRIDLKVDRTMNVAPTGISYFTPC